MTLAQINQRVRSEADARLSQVIERLLFRLRQSHTHRSHLGECHCNYCRFINNEYTNARILLHKIKRRLDYYNEFDSLSDTGAERLKDMQRLLGYHLKVVSDTKAKKFDLWTEVL